MVGSKEERLEHCIYRVVGFSGLVPEENGVSSDAGNSWKAETSVYCFPTQAERICHLMQACELPILELQLPWVPILQTPHPVATLGLPHLKHWHYYHCKLVYTQGWEPSPCCMFPHSKSWFSCHRELGSVQCADFPSVHTSASILDRGDTTCLCLKLKE